MGDSGSIVITAAKSLCSKSKVLRASHIDKRSPHVPSTRPPIRVRTTAMDRDLGLDRRTLLRAGAVGAGVMATGLVTPALASASPLVRTDRPVLTHGVQSGDVTTDG